MDGVASEPDTAIRNGWAMCGNLIPSDFTNSFMQVLILSVSQASIFSASAANFSSRNGAKYYGQVGKPCSELFV